MTISEASALLDANILVYADQAQDEHHEAAKAIRDLGQRGELALCVTPQVLNEYFAVVTNPRRVTRPLQPANDLTPFSEIEVLTPPEPEPEPEQSVPLSP